MSGVLGLVCVIALLVPVHPYGVPNGAQPAYLNPDYRQAPAYSSAGSSQAANPSYGDSSLTYRTGYLYQGSPGTSYVQPAIPAYGGNAYIQGPVDIPIDLPCSYDQRCYRTAAGCTLRNAAPFERRTPISCEACLQLCQEKRGASSPYLCQSVIYDVEAKSCDVFAVDHESLNMQLVKYPSRTYFKPVGQCKAVVTPVSFCPVGKLPKLIEVHGYVWSGFSGNSLSGYSMEECAAACLANKAKSDQPFGQQCKAARYENGICEFSYEAVPSLESFVAAPGVVVFFVRCLPEQMVRGCPGNFELAPQHVLIGYAEAVITADLENCIEQCINEQRFNCKSGMVYAKMGVENCVLNSETRISQPGVYLDETSEVALYFDTKCNVTPTGSYKTRLMDESAVEKAPQWTQWSACYNGQKTRYLNCGKKDVRTCPFETASCK